MRRMRVLAGGLIAAVVLSACGTENAVVTETISESEETASAVETAASEETEEVEVSEETEAVSAEPEETEAASVKPEVTAETPAEPEETEEIVEDEEETKNDATDKEDVRECDVIPCGAYDLDETRYVIISTYDDDDSGECVLTFIREDDGYYADWHYYDIENIEGDTYSATNWDENISVTITFSDGGMDLSGGIGKELSGGTGLLEEYNGHYTLRQDNTQW